MNRKIFTPVLVYFLFSAAFASSEIILLKSGKTISGDVLESTKEYIKIDVCGIPIKYYEEEVLQVFETDSKTGNSEGPITITISNKSNKAKGQGSKNKPTADYSNEFKYYQSQKYYSSDYCQNISYLQMETFGLQHSVDITAIAVKGRKFDDEYFYQCGIGLSWSSDEEPANRNVCEKKLKKIRTTLKRVARNVYIDYNALSCQP